MRRSSGRSRLTLRCQMDDASCREQPSCRTHNVGEVPSTRPCYTTVDECPDLTAMRAAAVQGARAFLDAHGREIGGFSGSKLKQHLCCTLPIGFDGHVVKKGVDADRRDWLRGMWTADLVRHRSLPSRKACTRREAGEGSFFLAEHRCHMSVIGRCEPEAEHIDSHNARPRRNIHHVDHRPNLA